MTDILTPPRPELDLPPLISLDEHPGLTHPAVQAVARWSKDYLCAPHSELGRNGPVCPFVPTSMAKRLIFTTVYDNEALGLDTIKAILLREMERFIALQPTSGNEAQFKSLMVLFPRINANDAETLIERAQAELQQHFVPNGLMVGEFHAGPPDKRGLWNPEFRPLYSPIPMLVIRHMVPTDILFLNQNAQLFRQYANIYGTAVPERFRSQFEEAAQRFDMKIAAPDQRPAAPRVLLALDEQKASYQVHCHDSFDRPIRTPADFAAALGYELSRITKTLFLKGRASATHYLLVCSMDKRVDLTSLADKLNAGRLEMASLDDLRDMVGYPPTSVTPIGVAGIPVLMDESLFKHATVLTGAGVPRVEIEVSPDTLATLCQARSMAMG